MQPKPLKIAKIILLIVVLGVGGWLLMKKPVQVTQTSPMPTQALPPSISNNPGIPTNSGVVSDNCNLFSNSEFRSVNQYETGFGPNGTSMGYWSIQFGSNTFQWSHSDMVESGTYTCANSTLQVKFFDHSLTARYDGASKILTWDGIEYAKIK